MNSAGYVRSNQEKFEPPTEVVSLQFFDRTCGEE
jgi:hypothetical protein